VNSPVLGVYGISFSYGRTPVLEDVSLELERGEILALLGPNGSGKSTLLKAIAGILPLTAGVVRHRGEDFLRNAPQIRARSIVYVPPDLHAEFPLTAREAVTLGRSCHLNPGTFRYYRSSHDRELVREAMERCLCWGFRDQDLHTLSGGERQLVALARALVQGAKVLLLDEALSRMDLNHQAAMGKLLRELTAEGSSIVLVSHDVNLASEWADTGLLLKKGQSVAFGPIKTVLTEENVRKLYPGSELSVGASPATGAPKVFFGTFQS